MQYQYGAPSPIAERPRCWSKAYDEGTRECRGCGFQISCKEEIFRQNASRQPAPVQSYQPYSVPQPAQVIPFQPQPFRGATLVQQPQQAQRPTYPPPSDPYGYGWIQDPLSNTLHSAPPPVRPQMGNESFFNRVAKNAGLAMMEAFFGQCLLAVRQMVLPPNQKQIVDVTPQQGSPTEPPFRQ